MTKAEKYIAIGVLTLVVIAAFVGFAVFGGTKQQAAQESVTNANTGQPVQNAAGQPISAAAYTPFPLGTVTVNVKDAATSTSSVTTTTVKGNTYPSSYTKDQINNVQTQPIASVADAAGVISFSAGSFLTGTSYQMRVWDSASTPAYYPELISLTTPAYSPSVGSNAPWTYADSDEKTYVTLKKVGAFANPMGTTNASGVGGGSLPTGVTSQASTNTITINQTALTTSSIAFRITANLADNVTGSYIKNVVMKPMPDTTNPMSQTAFTSVTFTPNGNSLPVSVPNDITSYVNGLQPVSLGDWSSSTSVSYYLGVTIDNSSIKNNDKFLFYLDDQKNYQGTDDLVGKMGATAASITITVTQ